MNEKELQAVLSKLHIVRGDITTFAVDAIVNAANTTLLGGGGVDGAIHRAAGPQLLEECKQLHGCATGDAKITKGYNLPARFVIHTVGPVWRGGSHNEENLLAQCYRRCFEIAQERKLRTLAFPSISTGAYGFPLERAVPIALKEIITALSNNQLLEAVYVVCFDEYTYSVYKSVLSEQQQ
jgi:O-acetyl-ADP-ribose deacetylase (regulator of RNase III)